MNKFLGWLFITHRLRDAIWHALMFILATSLLLLFLWMFGEFNWLEKPYNIFMDISVFVLFPAGYLYGLYQWRKSRKIINEEA